MLFTGHSEHTIDAKLRLAIPAKYRNQWNPAQDGGAWISVPWPNGRLRLYTEGRFGALAEKLGESLTPGDAQAELEAALFGLSERLEMDTAGRISIPKRHLELTKLGTEVVVVGSGGRLEVWDKQAYLQGEDERFRSLPGLVERRMDGHGSGSGPGKAR